MTERIYIREDTISTITQYLSRENILVITDENVDSYYRSLFQDYRHIVVKPGEQSKTLSEAERIIAEMNELGCNRDTLLIGFGGGVVCDLTGFVASIFKRGISHGFIATSLIAQADAALGGKNGVNVRRHKNLCGSFKVPEFILCPVNLLKTLPDEEISNGMAEVIKTGLIGSSELLDILKFHTGNPKEDLDFLYECVSTCGKIKCSIVERDFEDRGERRILNFGHTIGHALEEVYGLKHGQAVGLGMIHVLRLTLAEGLIDEGTVRTVVELLKKYNLPVKFDYDMDKILAAVSNDRKNKDGSIKYICLTQEKRKTHLSNANAVNPDDPASLNSLTDFDISGIDEQ